MQECFEEIQTCHQAILHGLTKLSEFTAAGAPAHTYEWATGGDTMRRQMLQLVESKSLRMTTMHDIVAAVHGAHTGQTEIPLTPFTVPNPSISIKWKVTSLSDVAGIADCIFGLQTWFESLLGPDSDKGKPAAWLVAATRMMQQLGNLCDQYVDACESDKAAAFSEFLRLCATKRVFTPLAYELLQRMGAPTEIWIRPAVVASETGGRTFSKPALTFEQAK